MSSAAEIPPVLEMRGVRFGYGRDDVIRGLDLVARRGSVIGLIGPNGCGKTTTLHLACGLLRPSRGTIAVAGNLLPGAPRVVNASLAYVPDSPSGFEHLTSPEYYRLVAAVHRTDADYTRRTADLALALGLEPYERLPLGSLSYGTRRKVALVAGAALDRSLLLLDEATNGLDPEAVIILERLIRAIAARGRTVLVATQDVYFAERVCDEVALLRDGVVAARGSVAAVKTAHRAATLRDVFLAVTSLDMAEGVLDAAMARADDR